MRGKLIEGLKADLLLLRDLLNEWLEWMDAKCWAKEHHPGWLQIARKAKTTKVRQIYRDKIMKAYQGGYDDGKE